MPRKTKPAIERVMNRIEMIPIAGCWIFMGALNESGYGIVGKGGRGYGNDRAHRITYSHFIGEIPECLFVCHKCDQPACCNPNHLFLGTNQDNVTDCIAKGRKTPPPKNPHVVGIVHPGHKLDDEKVRKIREFRNEGYSTILLSKQYGVSESVISRVCSRQSWKHVL